MNMTMVKTSFPMGKTFNGLFNELMQDFPVQWEKQFSNNWSPAVNIHETNEAYHLEMNAPGRDKTDFKVSVKNNELTVAYEKKESAQAEGYKTIRREYSYRSFRRSFELDELIDAENIQAKYENGVLKLYLPKKEKATVLPKEITIN
jgi:HSP20 family protein